MFRIQSKIKEPEEPEKCDPYSREKATEVDPKMTQNIKTAQSGRENTMVMNEKIRKLTRDIEYINKNQAENLELKKENI